MKSRLLCSLHSLLASILFYTGTMRSYCYSCLAFTKPQTKKTFHSRLYSSLESQSTSTLPPLHNDNVHRMVLMRHGESEFNKVTIFTGWCDVGLTRRGVVESIEAGEVFEALQINFDKCYTSVLTRSIVTAQRSLQAAGLAYTPLQYDWRLNERHYGALQGLSKERTAVRLGRDIVMKWRRSYDARPPLMTPDHPHHAFIYNDPRYRHLPNIPLSESLQECQERVVKGWYDIVKDAAATSQSLHGNSVNTSLIVAHANTLRALVMHLDDIPVDKIEDLNIPTAVPFFYDIDKTTGKVYVPETDADNSTENEAGKFRGVYISDERKKRSFLERRRAANDPFVWALHDYQVRRDMLVDQDYVGGEGLDGLEEEARQNTETFTTFRSR